MPSLKDRVENLEIAVAALRDAVHARDGRNSKNLVANDWRFHG
jgi:hypothetical protein